MKDDFPEMPTRLCPDCRVEKKIMFFSKRGTYCRDCTTIRNRWQKVRNTIPADREYMLDAQIDTERDR